MNSLHISNQAKRDLEEIKTYIAEELGNPKAALTVVRNITKSIAVLKRYAYAGATLFSITGVKSAYRFLVSGKYIVFYQVQGTEVLIDRVLYGGRNYMQVLFRDTLPDEIEEQ